MPQLELFNTMERRLVPFEPLVPGEVRLYTCGPTVYNHIHIGNLRTFLFEDVLRRSLRFLDYRVTQVMNITDVDDKIIRAAGEEGVSIDEYTAPFIESFFRDLDTLHIERAEYYPRATEHLEEMVEIVERLLEAGYAYESDGSVFFSIAKDPDYGRLSGIDLTQVRRGERVASDEYGKEDVRDFVLWKAEKADETSWDSPWGRGRPGWHLECSAMSMKYLGETFDLHSGGVDNIFPHHENEIAQSESATGKEFVRYWIHAEHLLVDGEKMSKSLGNQYTLSDLLQRRLEARAIRFLLLSAHYRQKLNFTFEAVEDKTSALRRLDEMRFRLTHAVESEGATSSIPQAVEGLRRRFRASLQADLNMAEALAAVFIFVKEVNVAIEAGSVGAGDRQMVLDVLREIDQVLGILDPVDWGQGSTPASDDGEIDRLVAERQAARERRDFAAADRIRKALEDQGVVVEDTPQGPRWKRT